MFRIGSARLVAVLAGVTVLVAGQALPASASTGTYSQIVTASWQAGFDYTQNHDGDDIGVNITTEDHMYVRWATCSGSQHGSTYHLWGDGQGAVKIGNNFRRGTCLTIETKSYNGYNTGSYSAGVYWNYNIS
jgi:hypothetical protein